MWHSKDCYKTVQYVLNRKIQANLVTVTITVLIPNMTMKTHLPLSRQKLFGLLRKY